MASIPAVYTQLNDKAVKVLWETMGDDDTGVAADLTRYSTKSVQIAGTIGAGTVVLNVSNDGTNYVGATYKAGTAISGAGLFEIDQASARFFRPVTASGSSNDVDVTIIAICS